MDNKLEELKEFIIREHKDFRYTVSALTKLFLDDKDFHKKVSIYTLNDLIVESIKNSIIVDNADQVANDIVKKAKKDFLRKGDYGDNLPFNYILSINRYIDQEIKDTFSFFRLPDVSYSDRVGFIIEQISRKNMTATELDKALMYSGLQTNSVNYNDKKYVLQKELYKFLIRVRLYNVYGDSLHAEDLVDLVYNNAWHNAVEYTNRYGKLNAEIYSDVFARLVDSEIETMVATIRILRENDKIIEHTAYVPKEDILKSTKSAKNTENTKDVDVNSLLSEQNKNKEFLGL